tara:strand:+ start:50212 stop:50511 length:300 start_codon:yes stop_codon:yes gene_type:complete
MNHLHPFKLLYAAIILGALVLQPSVAHADNFANPCNDTYESVRLRVVSVEIDGEDDPTHPAIGSSEFSLRARKEGGIHARLADPITGEAQSLDLGRLGQ